MCSVSSEHQYDMLLTAGRSDCLNRHDHIGVHSINGLLKGGNTSFVVTALWPLENRGQRDSRLDIWFHAKDNPHIVSLQIEGCCWMIVVVRTIPILPCNTLPP